MSLILNNRPQKVKFSCEHLCTYFAEQLYKIFNIRFEPCHEKTCFLHKKICAAYRCLYFCYVDSTITLLSKSKISSHLSSSVALQHGFCRTWLETRRTCFLVMQLINRIQHWCPVGTGKSNQRVHCSSVKQGFPLERWARALGFFSGHTKHH